MVTTAAIIGGATLASGALASSSSKKGSSDSGQQLLAEIAAKLFGETEPLRAETINQALQALQTGEVDTPLLQQKRSSILAEGERQKSSLEQQLSRAGLRDSSVGIASMEGIDRAIAQLLSNANTADLERLTSIGTTAGFGQTPATATSAAGALAQSQANQFTASTAAQAGTGKALGEAIALLLNQKSNPPTVTPTSTPSSTTGSLNNTWDSVWGID